VDTPRDIINDVLAAWALEFIQNRVQAAQKLGSASGRGKNSFDYKVIKGEVARVLFEFEGYMRFQDMRKVRNRGNRPFEDILQYVKDKGVNKFINGFKYKIPSSNVKLMNQIAWGIVKSKKPIKRKKWYNKGKEKDIHSLYGRLLAALREHQADTLRKSLAA